MIELTNRAPIRSKESRIFFSGRGSSFFLIWENASSTKVEIAKSLQRGIRKHLGYPKTNPFLKDRPRWYAYQA